MIKFIFFTSFYLNLFYYILSKYNLPIDRFIKAWGWGIGDWGLGIGDWGLGIGPNPPTPIPQPPIPIPKPPIFPYKTLHL